MAGRAADLIEIPATLWQRAAMTEALGNRDMGRVFQLVRQYAGASQTQLAIACGMTQGKVSDIMRDRQRVTALEVFERIADGPTNITLHRINIAVTLGDAGAAIDTARTVNFDQVTVTERKASLLIDTARAFLQYSKHENACLALRAARNWYHSLSVTPT